MLGKSEKIEESEGPPADGGMGEGAFSLTRFGFDDMFQAVRTVRYVP
jgi:hypothetical protein